MTDNTPSEGAMAMASAIFAETFGSHVGATSSAVRTAAFVIDRHLPAAEPVACEHEAWTEQHKARRCCDCDAELPDATPPDKVNSDPIPEISLPLEMKALSADDIVYHDAGLVEAVERVLKWVEPITGDNHSDAAAAEELASVEALRAALSAIPTHAVNAELVEALQCAPLPARREDMGTFRARSDAWLRDYCKPALTRAKGDGA